MPDRQLVLSLFVFLHYIAYRSIGRLKALSSSIRRRIAGNTRQFQDPAERLPDTWRLTVDVKNVDMQQSHLLLSLIGWFALVAQRDLHAQSPASFLLKV
jgi:hypothetical protein